MEETHFLFVFPDLLGVPKQGVFTVANQQPEICYWVERVNGSVDEANCQKLKHHKLYKMSHL